MNFVDHKIQNILIQKNILKSFDNLFKKGDYIQGDAVALLENQLAKFTGSKYCIGVANGTDALLISLLAIGIKPGDEILVPAFNYISAAEVIVLIGAIPVFIDVDENNFNINVSNIQRKITRKTKALIATSLFGQCADFNEIDKICKPQNIEVIEDAAQSFGASYYDKKSGNLTSISTTSFFPSKPLGCYGDGGAIFTNKKSIYNIAKKMRAHGQEKKYVHTILGMNSRLDTMQALVLIEKLKLFNKEIKLRQLAAKNYHKLILDINNPSIIPPYIEYYNKSVFAQFTIRSKKRNKLIEVFRKNNIPYAIHYPKIVAKQKPFNNFYKNDCPVAEKLSKEVISLPFHPYIKYKDQLKVVKCIEMI